MLTLELPYPPSINRYYRHVGYRTLISREGRTFRTNVLALLGGGFSRKPPSGGRIALCMDAFPPDRRIRDIDNLQKPVLDSMQHGGVYEDDSQVDLLLTQRRVVVPGGRLEVRVIELPLRRCPLCGAQRNWMHKVFPTILIVLDVCAALAYVPTGDWRRVVYWLAAAVLTAMVTW